MGFKFNLPSNSFYVESVLITFIYLKKYRFKVVGKNPQNFHAYVKNPFDIFS